MIELRHLDLLRTKITNEGLTIIAVPEESIFFISVKINRKALTFRCCHTE